MGVDLEFLTASLDQHRIFLEAQFRKARPGRGAVLLDLLRYDFDALVAEMANDRTVMRLDEPNPRIAHSYHRILDRYVPRFSQIYGMIATYVNDVGRQDVPVGILHLVDLLIAELLASGGDPLIHLQPERMYSTFSLDQRPGFPNTNPIVFNLPALDPANVLWTPILAHEVGHSAFSRNLAVKLDRTKALTEVDRQVEVLLDSYKVRLAAEGVTDLDSVEGLVADWSEELLCDALATLLTGPSFLFALTSFLVASTQNAPSSHPPPRVRVALCIDLLDSMGWLARLEEACPQVLAWTKELAGGQRRASDAQLEFVQAGTELVLPAIRTIAESAVKPILPTDDNWAQVLAGKTLLNMGIPAVQLDEGPLTPWQIVLAGWLSSFEGADDPDHPYALATAPYNVELNSLLVKSIELSYVVQLWGADERTT